MTQRLGLSFVLLVNMAISTWVLAEGETNKDELMVISAAHRLIESMNREDLNAYLQGVDPSAPIFEHHKIVMGQLFTAYDLNTKAEKIKILSIEKDYAVARLSLSKRKVRGQAYFAETITDSLWIFRRKEKFWRLWSTLPLSVTRDF